MSSWLAASVLVFVLAGQSGPADALAPSKSGKASQKAAAEKKDAAKTGAAGASTAPAAPAPVEPEPIVLKITSDKSIYQAGDRLTIGVEADKPCYLTLIGIEASGLATVLFPNDLEPDNALQAAVRRQVPAETSGYALRLDQPGIESVLAICTAVARRPYGIGHDYEHQRFTIIGDWADFSRTAAAREAEVVRRIADENRKRARKRRNGLPQIVDPPPQEREPEGRALLLLPVEGSATSTTARGP